MRKLGVGILSFVILGLVGVLAILERGESGFSVEHASAQSCSVPAQVQGVEVQFPKCDGDVCDFTMARCVWSAMTGATAYNVVITQVESGSVVYNQSVGSSTLLVDVAIVQNNTYQCEVAAVNSCGAGTAGTHSLFCSADAIVDEPTPTIYVPPATATPLPVIPPTGGIASLPALVGVGAVLLSAAGVYMFRRK